MGKMIAALKKLGNKLNGKVPVMDNTVGVINEIADDYEKPDLTPYATKTYVDGLMSGALKRQIVQVLPQTNIDTNTIYMVLDQEASQPGNVYNEYLYINENWELIGTTQVSGSGVEYVEIDPDGGTLGDDDYQKLINGAYIKFAQNREAEFNGGEVICLPNHSVDELVYSSVVRDGKYYQVEFTVVDRIEFECTYTVTEKSVGGSGIEYVYLLGSSGTLDGDALSLLRHGAYIKYNDVVLIPNGSETYEQEEGPSFTIYYYTSTVKNGKYYSLRYTISGIVISSNYIIEEISVGGGLNIVELYSDSGTLTQTQYNDIVDNNATVKYNDMFFTKSLNYGSPKTAYILSTNMISGPTVNDGIYFYQCGIVYNNNQQTYSYNIDKVQVVEPSIEPEPEE